MTDPLAHYDATGLEIVAAVEASLPSTVSSSPVSFDAPLTPPHRPSSGIVDLLVCGAGTGGTISGISRRLKDQWGASKVQTLGVDPVGSILARPSALNGCDGVENGYAVEGIGYDFIPDVLDHGHVDAWIKGTDDEAFAMARELIRTEGLLVGGSSGQAMAGAIKYLKSDEGWERFGGKQGKNVVVVMPDSIRNYVTKPWLAEGEGTGETTEQKLLESLTKSS